MNIYRVTDAEWQRAGVHYIRATTIIGEFGADLKTEFLEDTPRTEYILVTDDTRKDFPVSTCRLHFLDDHTGKIERVCTLKEYRGQHYGAACIREAEKWMQERGVDNIYINSREAALGFYEKLGYTPDYSTRSGSGLFVCIMMHKQL